MNGLRLVEYLLSLNLNSYRKLYLEQMSKRYYFMMSSTGHEIAFLYISGDPIKWEMGEFMLEQRKTLAVVVKVTDSAVMIKQI